MRVTQDDSRENEQIKIFNLKPLQGRSNKYIPDASVVVDGEEYFIELKTSDIAKKQVSTARNVTLNKIKEWKRVVWIFSQYQKTATGFVFTGEHYLAFGEDLEPWFQKQRDKINNGTPTYAGLADWESIKKYLPEGKFSGKIQKLDNSFRKKGCGLNDPKISWKHVAECSIKVNSDELPTHLRRILKKGRKNES